MVPSPDFVRVSTRSFLTESRVCARCRALVTLGTAPLLSSLSFRSLLLSERRAALVSSPPSSHPDKVIPSPSPDWSGQSPQKPEGLPPGTWTESELLGLVTAPFPIAPDTYIQSLWMAALHVAWSPVHVCGSPGTAGVNVTEHSTLGWQKAGRGRERGALLTWRGLRKGRLMCNIARRLWLNTGPGNGL